MDLRFLCSDSQGVRSMAIFIDSGIKISIDPSASLGPYRYGLRPTEIEYRKLQECKKKINSLAEASDIIIITHYHYDHYDPEGNFYDNKRLIIKNPEKNINRSQRIRAEYFTNRIKKYEIGDSNTFDISGTRIKISPPFHHGDEKSKLGFVFSVTVERNGKVLFSSDVEGPIVESVADYIINENPDLAIIDGPPTYFLGYRFSQRDLERSIENLKRISREIDRVVLDHHLLRDLSYRERLGDVYKNGNIFTYAEMNNEEINMLEAHRKDLYKQGSREMDLEFEE
ncbi:MAG: MBL fold metallo-hydrolase [Thermoplasmata archaeon]|jgi:predicted metallo-beta-lactamase superfamily hydrolase|nr:MBL fold metallo-hydrolase [Thermoplasmatales archaeon]